MQVETCSVLKRGRRRGLNKDQDNEIEAAKKPAVAERIAGRKADQIGEPRPGKIQRYKRFGKPERRPFVRHIAVLPFHVRFLDYSTSRPASYLLCMNLLEGFMRWQVRCIININYSISSELP